MGGAIIAKDVGQAVPSLSRQPRTRVGGRPDGWPTRSVPAQRRPSWERPDAPDAARSGGTPQGADHPVEPVHPADPAAVRALAERAERAGVTAVWTADCSSTVELRRLTGPHDRLITAAEWRWGEPDGGGPWRLACPAVRVLVYQRSLLAGSQYEIYRWVNLMDLARIWPVLDLPVGIRGEWARALRAAGLPAASDGSTCGRNNRR
jgi:hypothetical protein